MACILFIEDEAFTVRALAETLDEVEGFEVDLVNSLARAVELLVSKQYDLLILDIMLPHGGVVQQDVSPKQSGIAFAKMLREGRIADNDVSLNANIPVIVLTAVVDPRSIANIRELEPRALLRKPVTWKEFHHAIRSVLSESAPEAAE